MPEYVPDPDEGAFAAAEKEFAQLTEWLEGAGAAGLEHAELDRRLDRRGREVQRLLLQAHLDLRAARERRRPAVAGPDGSGRTRAEPGHRRPLASVSGQVMVRRIAYRAPGAADACPADAELNLPPGKHSRGLGGKLARAAAGLPAARACEAVFRETGTRTGPRRVAELTGRAAADARSFCARPRPVRAAAPGDVLVVEADGKGIRMRPDPLRPRAARRAASAAPRQDGRLSRGEVRTRKRMAGAGAVFEVTPAPRTPGDILPGPGAAASPAGAPRASGKWLTASVAAGTAQVTAAIFAEADRRDPGREQAWIALAGGSKDQIARIRAEAAARRIEVPVLIGFIHVTGYLRDAAWCFHPEASPGAGPWAREHARALLEGRCCQVAAAIRARAAATTGLSQTKRATAARTARYLETKAPYLGYPAALAAGWPISTGVIEGACRHLAKDRTDIAGARWSTDGAEAILHLRAIIANGDWDQYRTWHLDQEYRRTYRHHRNCYQLAA